jgi:hypothetical protein
MTCTQIGNYGVNEEDIESAGGIKAEGFIVKEACDFPSNWRSSASLTEYMKKYNVVGIQGLDTRALTKHLRNYGAQAGIISTIDEDPSSLLKVPIRDICPVWLRKSQPIRSIPDRLLEFGKRGSAEAQARVQEVRLRTAAPVSLTDRTSELCAKKVVVYDLE